MERYKSLFTESNDILIDILYAMKGSSSYLYISVPKDVEKILKEDDINNYKRASFIDGRGKTIVASTSTKSKVLFILEWLIEVFKKNNLEYSIRVNEHKRDNIDKPKESFWGMDKKGMDKFDKLIILGNK